LLSSTAQRRKQIAREWSDDVESSDRYVDIGVHLRIVRADPNGEVLMPGGRPMVVVAERHYGGMLDTAADPPCIPDGPDGYSQHPQEWLCSEDQFAIIEHRDDEPVGKLALGGMGAGKTTAGIIWLYLRWLEELGTRKEIGITAPTETRLSLVFNELFKLFPVQWWRFNSESKIVTLCDGFRFRGVSTHRQSQSAGSRIQAFNWVGLLDDEAQDSIDEFIHKMARLRSKPNGRAKRLATATAKDLPEWRTLKDQMLDSGDWVLHSLLGIDSPFVNPSHWEVMRRSMTDREYRRLVLAEDLPPESRVYNGFDRKRNLRPIPLGARKITSLVIGKKIGGDNWGVGIGHDPGTAKAASVWLDAYDLSRAAALSLGTPFGEPIWFARAELFTLHATPEQHATKAMAISRERFGCNIRPGLDRAHVRCQPLGSAEDKPDLSTIATWRRVGFDIRVAQYSKAGTGVGQIKKDARFAVVNTLFEKSRLFLECDDQGRPCTPLLLNAIEVMERDDKGRAEHEEKDVRHDKSDLPAALGYWLWPFEKELATALRDSINRALG
jgi:hypothetical protein